jgi:hypothetical protein
MSELDPFETRFSAVYRRYLAEAPVEADPVAIARRAAAAGPRHWGLAGFRPFGQTPAMAWVLLLATLLLALVVGGLAAGSWRREQAVVIAPSPTPTAMPTATPAPTTPPATSTGSMTTARSWHTATLLADGRVLIAGGSESSKDLASAELYDPKTGTFSPTGPMTTARHYHTATLLADGRVLIVGGGAQNGLGVSEVLSSGEIYDPKTRTFSPTGPMTTARDHHTATLLPDGRVLVTGGEGVGGRLASAEIFDPKTGTFSPTGPMTTDRAVHTATLLDDGHVLVTGGVGAEAQLASAELYDPKTGTFSPTGSMTTARDYHTATLLADGRVLIAGGYPGSSGGEGLASAEVFDPKTGTFSPTGSMTTARVWYTATLLADGRVLIAGGTRGVWDEIYASAELYDPTTGRFGPTGPMTTARVRHTATLLADGRVLITGGDGVGSADLFVP